MNCPEISPTGTECIVDGEHGLHDDGESTWIVSFQRFDDWADENDMDEEERSEMFLDYMEEMTGQDWSHA